MKPELKKQLAFYLFPVFLLLVTRVGIEFCVTWMPVKVAWIASFAIYYILILLISEFARRKQLYDENAYKKATVRLKPVVLFWGVVLPALLPVKFFISNYSLVPWDVFGLIILIALINPFFEERFWRRLMSQMPGGKTIKIIYSAFWFSAGHYILWASYWFTDPKVWIATVAATFVMGLLWMSFYLRTGNYKYIIISHMLVDFFNLSAAVYLGLDLKTI